MPDKSGVSRRDLFQIIGSVPAIAAVTGGEAAAATPKAGPYKRQTFDDHQWHTVRVLCNLIIPADERSPGATEAGVPEFLDDWIAFRTEQEGNQDLRAEILGGFMWLDHESQKLFQKDFADASEAQQKQILDRIAYPKRASKEDQPGASFFSELRILVIGGFFSSKAGVADLPYLGNVAVMEWKGCDPKVWAVIEERMKNGYKGILEAKPWGA
jgi:hypothetical protein